MTGEFRLRARMLQNGKLLYSFAIMLCAFSLAAASGGIPVILETFIGEGFSASMIKAAAALVLAFACLYTYFALSCGTKNFFLKSVLGERKLFSNLFFCFRPSRVVRTAKFGLCMAAVKLLSLLVFLAPFALMLLLELRMLESNASLSVLTAFTCGLAVMLLCCLYFYFRMKRLTFLCKYLFAADEALRFSQCMRISVRIMSRVSRRLFLTRLSFAGWLLLCVLILPIPYVWGYYEQTMAVFAADLIYGASA